MATSLPSIIRYLTNIHLPGFVLVCCSSSCHIDNQTHLCPSYGSAPLFSVSPAACTYLSEACARHQTRSPRPGQLNSVPSRVDITGRVRRVSKRLAAAEADSHSYSCCEARSEEFQPEGPSTPGLSDSPAHPGSQRDCSLPRCDQSSTSLVADVPLANIILAHRDDTMTPEPVEQACDVHESSPPIMESVMQIFTEDACEQQK